MLLEVQDITVGYFHDIEILQQVSLQVHPSQIVAVIGPNGAGKSTLLKTICGFLTPKQGRILYNGEDITGLDPSAMIRHRIAYVPQERSIFPELTVDENLLLGAWSIRHSGKQAVRAAMEEVYLRFPYLAEQRHTRAGLLSGGGHRMLEIARSLVPKPQLLVLDEPTVGLAPLVVKEIYAKLYQLKEEAITILLVDQNVREAVALA
ncbi:MAG: ABC transporter ATP-binding protein, partial [Nitrospinota bacterium]